MKQLKLEDTKINEIAQELDTGFLCFIHKQTLELVTLPDQDNPYFDPTAWDEPLDIVDKNPGDYVEIERMDGRSSFEVMEDFAEEVTDPEISRKLFRVLSRKRPFANFKYWVEEFGIREDWFAFKQAALENWVRKQLYY